MKGISILLAAAGLLASGASFAGSVYRCDTAEGRSYVSKRVPGAQCEVVSSYTPPARAKAATRPAVDQAAGAPRAASVPPAQPAAAVPAATQASGGGTASSPRLVQGQVYSYMKDGVRHYSSQRPKGVAEASAVRTIRYSYMETCYACSARPGVSFASVRLRRDAFNSEIAAAASKFGVDEAIVRAIIHAESAFNPNAVSRAGAQGLMQLMPATARRFGVSNSFDPAQNIRGGVQYLAWLLKRFNGNLTLAAAGYNAGEGAVDKYKGVPPYGETQRYVQRVALLADRYRVESARN